MHPGSFYNSPPLVTILSQMNPDHDLSSYFRKTRLNIIHQPTPRFFHVVS